MKRGDVYWAELSPRSGSEQSGRRPVILLSNEVFLAHDTWRSLIVVPLSTSKRLRKRGPTVIHVPRASLGLPSDSFAIGHQVTTLDRGKVNKRVGTLSPGLLREVERAVKVAMDLP